MREKLQKKLNFLGHFLDLVSEEEKGNLKINSKISCLVDCKKQEAINPAKDYGRKCLW